MRRLFIYFSLIFLLLVLGIGLFYTFGTGLKEYSEAISAINKLPETQMNQAKQDFFTEDIENGYGGILAGVWRDKIWIRGKSSLIGFVTDNYSAYSFYSICKPGMVEKIKDGGGITVEKKVYATSTEWRQHVKVGDYVAITITKADMGGTIGNLREAYGYDWWVFLPGVSTSQCEK